MNTTLRSMNPQGSGGMSRMEVGGGEPSFDETQRGNSSSSDAAAAALDDDIQFNASLDALLNSDSMDDSNPMAASDGISHTYHASTHDGGAWTTQQCSKAAPPPQGLLTAESTGTWPRDVMPPPALNFYASPPVSNAAQSSMHHYSGPFTIPYAPDMTHHHVLPSNSGQHYQDPSSAMASFSSTMTTVPCVATMMGSRAVPPEPVISSIIPSSSSSSSARSNKRGITEVVSEDEGGGGGEHGQRRQDRNLREQQRSQKITQQIAELREVLAASNVPFKPDKYSTLVTVADYIKELQTKSTLLDVEHQRLMATIAKTNEIVSNQYVPASATGENPPGGGAYFGTDAHANGGGVPPADMGMFSEETSEETMLAVGGIDYRCIFSNCGVALAVASVDGRFLDCNHEFERLSGYERGELLSLAATTTGPSSSEDHREEDNPKAEFNIHKSLSLFNVLCREDMEVVFVAMSAMLKRPPPTSQEEVEVNKMADTWSGTARFGRDLSKAMRMNISLARSHEGRAKFFDCTLYGS